MSFESLVTALETVMKNSWTATAVAYENVPFIKPVSPWVMFTVITGEGVPYGIDGSAKYARDSGRISCQIFVPEYSGTKDAKGFVDDFNLIFELKDLSGVNTSIADVKSLGVSNGWHQTSVTIPFRRDRNV